MFSSRSSQNVSSFYRLYGSADEYYATNTYQKDVPSQIKLRLSYHPVSVYIEDMLYKNTT